METYTLVVTREEAQLILSALSGLPYGQVHQLIPKLMQQAQQQEEQPNALDT